MKTELYKMWLDFCKSKDMYMAHMERLVVYKERLDDGTCAGYVSFNYKLDDVKVAMPSPEYDAWRAFITAKEPHRIAQFIAKNFELFKDFFPTVCVFLDLHQIKSAADILTPKHSDLFFDFNQALIKDSYLIDDRKRS